jgi:hypothetical protein
MMALLIVAVFDTAGSLLLPGVRTVTRWTYIPYGI